MRWTIDDENELADAVAVVSLGQAKHAALLLAALEPMQPAFSTEDLRRAAVKSIEIRPGTKKEERARRWQRDGLLFEVISWVALIDANAGRQFLARDPHLGSTTQGLDGLVLELDATRTQITRAVIVEDKCSERPRRTFQSLVMPAFHEHHNNDRAPDLVATAANLLGHLADPSLAVEHAAAVLDLTKRGYRASLAIELGFASSPKREKLFDGYDTLPGTVPENREGGGFIIGPGLRPWFDQFASRVIASIKSTEI